MGIQAKRCVKLSRKYKLDCVNLQGRSREGTKKRALENEEQKTKKSPRRNLGRRSPSICKEKKAEAFRNFPAKKGSKTGP